MKDRVRSQWASAVLVCAKCSKKVDGGFGPKGKTRLAKALRQHVGVKKGRKGRAGIVEVKCLGVCPAGAVTVVNGAHTREWLLVPKGSDVAEVAADLGLAAPTCARAHRAATAESGGPTPASDWIDPQGSALPAKVRAG